MILTYIKKFWELLNKISPTNRNFIIIILLGFIFYNLICTNVKEYIVEEIRTDLASNKKAELYTQETAAEINRLVRLIADKNLDAYDVLLLSYHNNTQSLQGFRYLYLTCIAESPKELDTPLLKHLWDKIDYVYYADELEKIHNLGVVQIESLDLIRYSLPKFYHLIKASEVNAVAFYTIEGHEAPIGMVVILYKENPSTNYGKILMPMILRLAILLDYENMLK